MFRPCLKRSLVYYSSAKLLQIRARARARPCWNVAWARWTVAWAHWTVAWTGRSVAWTGWIVAWTGWSVLRADWTVPFPSIS